MCGLRGNIPSQNKDVCKSCDTVFWYHTKLDVVVKFCKGKNPALSFELNFSHRIYLKIITSTSFYKQVVRTLSPFPNLKKSRKHQNVVSVVTEGDKITLLVRM